MANNIDMEEFIRQLTAATQGMQDLSEAERDLLEQEKKAKEQQEAIANAGKKATESLGQFGKQLLTAGGGMSKYTGAVEGMGDAAFQVGKQFGPLGIAIGGLTKIITMITGAVFKQNDAMLKSADALTQIGVAGKITTKEILALGQKAGYASGELEQWTNIAKSLGTDLIALGVSATEGVKAFGSITEMDEKLLAGYSRLGISQEQLNKNQADYIKLQVASGVEITKRMVQDSTLRKASVAYTDNLLELAALSGEDVENIKKKQIAARSDLAVQTRLAILRDKELEAQSKGRTEDEKMFKAQREGIEKMLDIASNAGMAGDEFAGLQSVLATGNFNELSAGLATSIPGILEFSEAFKKGKATPGEFIKLLSDSTVATRRNIGEAIIQQKGIGKSFAFSQQMQELVAKYGKMSAAEIDKSIKDEKTANEQRKKGGDDAAKDARAAQLETERRIRLGADYIVGVLNGPVTSAFESLMKVMGYFVKGLAKVAGWLLRDDSIADAFATPEERAAKEQEKIDYGKPPSAQTMTGAGGGRGTGGAAGYTRATGGDGVSIVGGYTGTNSYLQKIAMLESGGKRDAKAGTSTASGLFQFTDATWIEMNKRTGKNYSLQDRFDPAKAAEMAAAFTGDNKTYLEKQLRRAATDADLYLAHFLGAGGAVKFLRAMASHPDGPVSLGMTPDQIAANKPVVMTKDGKARSLQDVYNYFSNKLVGASDLVASGKVSQDIKDIGIRSFARGGLAQGPESGFMAQLHGNELVIPMSGPVEQVMSTPLEELIKGKDEASKYKENAFRSAQDAMGEGGTTMVAIQELVTLMGNKMDDVIFQIMTGNEIQDKLLKYSKM